MKPSPVMLYLDIIYRCFNYPLLEIVRGHTVHKYLEIMLNNPRPASKFKISTKFSVPKKSNIATTRPFFSMYSVVLSSYSRSKSEVMLHSVSVYKKG